MAKCPHCDKDIYISSYQTTLVNIIPTHCCTCVGKPNGLGGWTCSDDCPYGGVEAKKEHDQKEKKGEKNG